jgi:hypothetical protein
LESENLDREGYVETRINVTISDKRHNAVKIGLALGNMLKISRWTNAIPGYI